MEILEILKVEVSLSLEYPVSLALVREDSEAAGNILISSVLTDKPLCKNTVKFAYLNLFKLTYFTKVQ